MFLGQSIFYNYKFWFIPICVETLGSWGPEGFKFIKEVGARIADISGDKRATSHLFQRLGISTQRGNATSIEGTVRNIKELEELYYL